MSARSRYLAAISPREGETIPTSNSPSYGKSSSPQATGNLKSPSDIMRRQRGGVGGGGSGNITNAGDNRSAAPPPPPPPPPGPPPKRNKTKQSSHRSNTVGSSSSSSSRPPENINIKGDPNYSSTNNNDSGNSSNNKELPARSGSPWSPTQEIKSGNVAKFQQMLWGGAEKEQPKKTGVSPKIMERQKNIGINNGSNNNVGGGSYTPGSPSLLPPATPPRYQGNNTATATATAMGGAGNVSSTTSGPSPRYKRNAPPPLNKDETPSLQLNSISNSSPNAVSSTPPRSLGGLSGSRVLPSPNRITPRERGRASPNTQMSPSLRQRAGKLGSLTPLDTGAGGGGITGGGQGGAAGDMGGVNSSVKNSVHANRAIFENAGGGGGGGAGGVYVPSPSNAPKTPSNSRTPSRDGYQRSNNTVKISNTSIANSPTTKPTTPSSYQQRSANTDDGISTLTAFKRPNAKVGIVFTRQSPQHPEVAIISRILPESIFSRHHQLNTAVGGGNEGRGGIEGAEVIAVNGTPVRDPRHAAELVARAVEEVRLTVKRGSTKNVASAGGVGDGDMGDNAALSRPHALSSRQHSERSQEGVELDDILNLPHAHSAGEESELSERTEDDEELSARTEERTEDRTDRRTETMSARERSGLSARSELSARTEEMARARSGLSVATEEGVNSVVTEMIPEESVAIRGRGTRGAQLDGRQQERQQRGDVSTAPTTSSSRGGTSASRSGGGGSVMTSATTPKSAEIAERRRKVAQAMLLSEELVEDPIREDWNDENEKKNRSGMSGDHVEDPITLNRSSEEESEFSDAFGSGTKARSAAGSSTISGAASGISGAHSAAHSAAASATPSGISGTASSAVASGISSTSAADKRRQAALQMYHSSEMVADNVDDVKLGTIDAVSPSNAAATASASPSTANAVNAANLATIGSGLPNAKLLSEVGRVTSFGSAASRAKTDVTTSSVATARMGGGSPRKSRGFGGRRSPPNPANASRGEFSFGDAAEVKAASALIARSSPRASSGPSSPPVRLDSPAAQRRRERAAQRRQAAGDVPVTASSGLKIPPSPTASPKTTTAKSMVSPPMPRPSSPMLGISRTKTDEESLAAQSNTAQSIAASSTAGVSIAASSTAGSSGVISTETPRSTRSRFGMKKSSTPRGGSGQSVYSQVQGGDTTKKKKSSIFGVAKLIRKASSKKSKSSKKGISLVDDTKLFDDTGAAVAETQVEATAPEQQKEEAAPQSQPPPLMEPRAAPQAAPSTDDNDPFGTPNPAGDDDGWENSDFFKSDPFYSSPFGTTDPAATTGASGEDAFGFPTDTTTSKVDNDAFFTAGADSWGEPSAMLPVDFTPKKGSSSHHHHFKDHDNSDSLSYDASEMSEVTNPTFASAPVIQQGSNRPDPEGTPTASGGKSKQHKRDASQESAPENSDSSVEGTAASGKENLSREGLQRSGGGKKKLPPSYSSAPSDKRGVSKDDNVDPPLTRLDTMESSDDDRDDNDQGRSTPTMAKSRILSKYANRHARRSNNANLGTIHGSPVRENKAEQLSSNRSLGSASARSLSQMETSSKTSVSSTKKNSTMPSSAEPTPTRKGSAAAAIPPPPTRGRASPMKQRNKVQEPVINPATTSSLARRRRMSPSRNMTSSTAGNASPSKSIGSRGSPQRSVGRYGGSGTRVKKVSPSVVDNPAYYSMESRLSQIKDPIQRAGVRLLWAAAIPIQTQARRFLARQAAIKRMCAVLTIQAFVRRWLAERDLEIAIWSAIQIQASFRGWFARDSLEDNHYCATQIQRVVRGYLATMHVFEDLYSITIVQSVVRRYLAINDAVDRLSSIIAIQSWWRGIKTRDHIEEMDYSAVAIQANWRRYLAQMSYQFNIIDIIIVQSVARRWKTRRVLAAQRLQCLVRVMIAKMRFREKQAIQTLVTRHTSATKIQARWRSHTAQMQLLHYIAATRIQARWRTHAAEEQYRLIKSATKIQSCWRSYSAQVHMLVSIVNVIVIQSLWRRRRAMKLYKPLLHRIKLAKERKRQNAATTIQSAWRGFVVYSEYLIKRYENKAATTIQAYWRGYQEATNYSTFYCAVVKVQALVRGVQERSWQEFQNECATIIQASSRRFLARKESHNECMVSILIAAAANSLRVRNAVTKLQYWWMEEMWKKREKEAALIIERFFIYVKKEVEKEVKALKKKKKERRRRRKMKQSDDYILERAWLGVADDAAVAPVPAAVPQRPVAAPQRHPVKKVYSRHDRVTVDEDQQSDVSGLTDLDFGYKNSSKNNRSRMKKNQKEYEEDASLEEAFRDSEAQVAKDKRQGSSGHRGQYPRRYDR